LQDFEKRFFLTLIFLFFGFWLVDFLMSSNGISSPFHWFYGALQMFISFIFQIIYYLAIAAAVLVAIYVLISIGIWLREIYVAFKKEFFTDENRTGTASKEISNRSSWAVERPLESNSASPKFDSGAVLKRNSEAIQSHSNVIAIAPTKPKLPAPVPLRPKMTEEEALQNAIDDLKERW
jgi:hypothetical protein